MNKKYYAAIDLKSFYASVECVERNLDPMSTNLVVADPERTEKTICLAVTPSLKALGIPGRARLFEVISHIKSVNYERKKNITGSVFSGCSCNAFELSVNPDIAADFIIAPPRMALYVDYSTRVYSVYLKYAAPEDIHVYSIDEIFIDITSYLKMHNMTAREFVKMLITDVYNSTGITAAAGIGTNLFLAKVAMDITAKHISEDDDGVRIAELDEMSYRKTLWNHRPLTDFWRVGKGYASSLELYGLFTMGDIARCSLQSEDLLYRLFGVNAELLIDHAWGYESCTLADIKAYKPSTNSISSGQVLQNPYDYEKTKLIVIEMTDTLVLNLVEKGLVTNQLVVMIGFDSGNIINNDIESGYNGDVVTDSYGRKVPKHLRCTVNLGKYTSSTKFIIEKVVKAVEEKINQRLKSKRITITACNVIPETEASKYETPVQLDFFTDYEELNIKKVLEDADDKREKRKQKAMIDIRNKYGKNAILKGMNYSEGATARDRNKQIGGHKA